MRPISSRTCENMVQVRARCDELGRDAKRMSLEGKFGEFARGLKRKIAVEYKFTPATVPFVNRQICATMHFSASGVTLAEYQRFHGCVLQGASWCGRA